MGLIDKFKEGYVLTPEEKRYIAEVDRFRDKFLVKFHGGYACNREGDRLSRMEYDLPTITLRTLRGIRNIFSKNEA